VARHLIVNCDDLGHPAGTVEATSRLFEAGLVSSATAMVNQRDWPAAARFLRSHPGLGAGVHLVMNEGSPLLPPDSVPSLVDAEGHFRDGARLLLRFGRLRTRELRAEWRAQIDAFVTDVGRPPDHLDLHCHYPYVFASWFRASLDLAKEYGHLPVRLPFDDALDQKAPEMAAQYGFPAWYVRREGRRYQAKVRSYGLGRPGYFETSFSRDGYRTPDGLLAILDGLPDGTTELLVHPGTEGWRAQDYSALLDPRVKARIEDLGLVLIRYADLQQPV
jgi:predicted glycoside hydrolase/deacetylase ChbG (UPF0249 family)